MSEHDITCLHLKSFIWHYSVLTESEQDLVNNIPAEASIHCLPNRRFKEQPEDAKGTTSVKFEIYNKGEGGNFRIFAQQIISTVKIYICVIITINNLVESCLTYT